MDDDEDGKENTTISGKVRMNNSGDLQKVMADVDEVRV